MSAAPRRQTYDRLSGDSPEVLVANELRELANRASPNSARAFEDLMHDEGWPDGVGHATISDVLYGRNAANKLKNVTVVTRAITRSIPAMDTTQQGGELRRITRVYEEAFQPPHTWALDITRHCSNAAFDWASALPYGPRDAHEVIATVAARNDGPPILRTEVLGPELARSIEYGVMQAAPARKAGNSRLPNDGWNNNSDDGPTWHGMWGPIGMGKPAKRFLAVHLDALGAVSVYLRVATSTGIEIGELSQAALDTAFQVIYRIGWRGAFGVIVRSVSPAAQSQKHREFTAWVPTRDGKSVIAGPASWTTLANTTVRVPASAWPDDFYGYMNLSANLARETLGRAAEDED